MGLAEWESFVICSRLKTKRQKKRLQKLDSDKKLIQLDKELKRLWRQHCNLGYEELVPPIQRGWKRTFVLKYDVEISRDADFFRSLLQKVNYVQYSHRRDFKVKKRRKGKKVYADRIQKLHDLWEWQFVKLTDKEKSFFKEVDHPINKYRTIKKYVFTEPGRFMLSITPNMITKVKIIDPLLLQQMKQMDSYIERRFLRPRLEKLKGGYSYKWDESPKRVRYKQLLKSNSLEKLYEEYLEEKQNE